MFRILVSAIVALTAVGAAPSRQSWAADDVQLCDNGVLLARTEPKTPIDRNMAACLSGMKENIARFKRQSWPAFFAPIAASYLQRARMREARGDHNGAVAEFDGLIKVDRDGGYNRRARFLEEIGEVERAIADYDKAIEIQPKYDAHYLTRSRALRLLGKRELALADLNSAIRISPDSNNYTWRMQFWAEQGDFDRALADANEAVRLTPNRPDFYLLRGELWIHLRKDFDHALADIDEAIRLKPENAKAYLHRGDLWKELKRDFDHAMADYEQAGRLDPSDLDVYLRRGNLWREIKGDRQRALVEYNEVIRKLPGGSSGFNNRGLTYIDSGQLDLAIADFGEAIRRNPSNAGSLALRGRAWRLKGDLDQSLADLDHAVKVDPGSGYVRSQRAETLRYKGDFQQAIAEYNEALRRVPDFAFAYVGRGLTLERLGDADGARADFEKALTFPELAYDTTKDAQDAARARLAALTSGAPQPIIPTAPAQSSTAIPTPPANVVAPSAASQPAPVANAPASAPASGPAASSPVVASAPSRPAVAAPVQGRRVALVIGNSNYKNVSTLANPSRDAEAIGASFRKIGFEKVTTLIDATREQFIEEMRTFANEAERADWAVVYYAGHGIEVGGMNYLIPVDGRLAADRDVQFEAVALEQIMASVESAKKLKLVILDACRDNPFATKMRRTVATRSIGRGLGRVEPEGATLVVYAAKHGQTALDGEGANSPFATAFVQRLATPNVEINKVFRLVRDDVMEATAGRQEPFTYGSLPGREDFYFATK
jgi:tetratricopeptide (TPR) repeat protein